MTSVWNKVTEIFRMAEDLCQIYDRVIKTSGLAPRRDLFPNIVSYKLPLILFVKKCCSEVLPCGRRQFLNSCG